MPRNILSGVLFVMASLVAFGQTATPPDAQEHKELQQIDRNAAQQKQDARTDRADLAQDKAAVHNDVKNGDMAAARKTSGKLARQKITWTTPSRTSTAISEWRVRSERTPHEPAAAGKP